MALNSITINGTEFPLGGGSLELLYNKTYYYTGNENRLLIITAKGTNYISGAVLLGGGNNADILNASMIVAFFGKDTYGQATVFAGSSVKTYALSGGGSGLAVQPQGSGSTIAALIHTY